MEERAYGKLTGHSVGIIMKEAVRRAISAIRVRRFKFEVEEKKSYKASEDFVTSADKEAQRICVKLLRENFPTFGIVAEEDELKVLCTETNRNIFFTADPLDGTKAFIRRQSHGIGSMIALVEDEEVVAACVGDVMTNELYYYRPGSEKVHRVSDYDICEDLRIDETRRLKDQYWLLRERPDAYSSDFIMLRESAKSADLFKNLEVSGGSIGITMARLWKGEVGAVLLLPGVQQPWDICPIIGISKKLGFGFFSRNGLSLREEFTRAPEAKFKTKRDVLVFHKSRFDEVSSWLAEH